MPDDIKAASSPAPAQTPSPAPTTSGLPTTTPGSPVPTPPTGTPPVGEPPRERWDQILANARTKTRAEVEAEFREKYGRYDQFEEDPWGAVQDWLSRASQHSQYAPHVQQWAARYLQSLRGTVPTEEPQANVPIVDANGNVTGYTYSDQQLKAWQKWNQFQQQQELEARLRPLEQSAQQMTLRESRREAAHQAHTTLADFRTKPYFKEHESEIRQALEEHEEWGDNLHAAYNHVLISKILPTLGQAEQRAVVQTLADKAAGTTVAPGSAAPGRPVFKTFREAAEYYAAHPKEAEAAAVR